jgi:hypothetical protein
MDYYIVFLRCGCDDLPLRIFHNYIDAEEYAKTVTPEHPDVERVLEILSIDVSMFCNVDIFLFTNHGRLDDGIRLFKVNVVKELDCYHFS